MVLAFQSPYPSSSLKPLPPSDGAMVPAVETQRQQIEGSCSMGKDYDDHRQDINHMGFILCLTSIIPFGKVVVC